MSAQARVIPMTEEGGIYSTSPREGEKMMHHGRPSTDVLRDSSISGMARCLYSILTTYANKDLQCKVSRARLARDIGKSVRSVGTWLAELEKAGVISRSTESGSTTNFTLAANRIETEPGKYTSHPKEVDFLPPGKHTSGGREAGFPHISVSSVKDQCESQDAHEGSDTPGVELSPDGVPRLIPTAYDTEGKPVYSSDAVLQVTKIANHITGTDLDLPLRAWIETHETKIPRSHDLQQLIRQVSVYGAERVTIGIRRMGDAGQLAMRHLVAWLQENATPIVTAGGAA